MHDVGHNDPMPQPPSHQEMARDSLAKYQEIGNRYWIWVSIFAGLTLLGIIGVIIRLNGGFEDRAAWGYHVGTIAFILSTFGAMPLIAVGLRLAKAHFRRPLARIAELGALSGIVVLLLLIPALRVLPALQGRSDIWFDFPLGAPNTWHYIAVATLLASGVGLAYFGALPDLAAGRDHLPPSWRQRFVSRLSLGWIGNLRAWRVQYMGVMILGAMYLLIYPLVQTIFVSDFHLGLIPGMKDAIFPATVTLFGLQGGVAMIILLMFIVRQAGGYERYLGTDQFWALSKPLLAFSLFWFYFWWSSFLTFWYGRTPSEISVMQLLFLGPYRNIFMASLFLNFLGPVIALIWNPVRRSIWGPTVVAAGILVGTWLNMMRIYVSSASVPDSDLFGHELQNVPAGIWPDGADILITMGAIGASALLFLLAAKIVPIISIWEVGEGLRLVKVRRFYQRWVRVIAKSH